MTPPDLDPGTTTGQAIIGLHYQTAHLLDEIGDMSDQDWTETVRQIHALRQVRADLGRIEALLVQDAYLRGEHGDHDIDGLGRVSITRARDRRRWDTAAITSAVLDAHLSQGDGEVPTPWETAAWITEVLATSYARVNQLRDLGLDPEDFCSSSPGLPQVRIS